MLLITFILLFVTICLHLKRNRMDLYCIATILFTFICYVSNEVFSIFYSLDKAHLSIFHLGIDIFLIFLIFRYMKREKNLNLTKWMKNIYGMIRDNKIGIAFFLVFVAMFCLAIFTIPYNWDSMTYHLPRITEWAQNKSVAHYATYDVRRLTSPVLPAFINLQVYIFGGSNDSIFNLLQYCSYITNAILIYQICNKFELEKKYCWLGMLLFASMPISFGEALSTQVDQFSTMWLLMFVYLLVDMLRENYCLQCNRKTVFDVVLLSSCIAYGYLAKPSIMFAMVFFALWLLVACIKRKDKVKDMANLILLAAIIIVLIISPEVIRNIITFGSISDPIAGKRQLVETLNPLYLLVNTLMNYTVNLPNIFIDWKDIIEHGVYWVAFILNVNISSPLIAEDGVPFYLHEAGRYNHDTAINPTIVIAATIAFFWLILTKIKRKKLDFQGYYIVFSFVAFLFLCCFVKWEPFVTRYMLSYLALLCPVVVIWLSKIKKKEYAYAIYGILVFVSICEVIGLATYHFNICKEGNLQEERTAGYFMVNGENADKYIALENELKELECNSIGLYLSMAATYEYPIWIMLDKDVRIESILVNNETVKYENEEFVPDYIIVIDKDENDIVNYKMKSYSCYKQIDESFSIWKLE